MRRRVLLCLTLIFVMSACNGDRIATPIGSPSSNTKLIVDGTDTDGNRDFFFLPPMVKQPATGSPWDVGAFNPNLRPTVVICDFGPASAAPLRFESAGPRFGQPHPAALRRLRHHQHHLR